ncbi:tyrosine-type recombinase/integrase [Edaphobacter modestus]|uniref:Site-specific recombinase XerD n=1 Tax=Edaphobacter modestus TaxID=388466 RepID=A0A4Q7YRB1_9BACT|nr:site-specific integrase [Edaphobacter modestus]RZU40028.1 site-specific recombinase XerD [Edaphobacter modestus]
MKSPVQLYLRVRLPDGSYPYLRAAFAANGRLRPHHAIHSGRATEFPGASYHLRYRIGEKRVWEPVGKDPILALTRVQQKVRDLQHVNDDGDDIVPQVVADAAARTSLTAEQPKPPLLLNEAIKEYLAEVKTHRSAKTFAAYRTTLFLFSPDAAKEAAKDTQVKIAGHKRKESTAKITRQFVNKPLADITRKDMLDYVEFLKKVQGSVPRTVRNRVDFFQIFLHHYGLPSLLIGKDLPQYTEKKVRAYNPSQLAKLFAEATQDEADLLHFFLCTGAREQEAQFVCWTDVDLELKTYTVTEHLDLGYQPKDKEEGSLPIPDVLVRVLKARRERYPQTRLIFPGKGGKPNGHALRVIKRLALRAGVNCGQCRNKAGKSCATHPVCRQFVLHKLRKTFATTLHHKGLPAQTLQRYLRHSDLDTTLKYIADADDATIRKTINSTFQGFESYAGGTR